MKQKLLSATILLSVCLASCKEAVLSQQQIDYSVQTVAETDVTPTLLRYADDRTSKFIHKYRELSNASVSKKEKKCDVGSSYS